jgi:hypothetical protein
MPKGIENFLRLTRHCGPRHCMDSHIFEVYGLGTGKPRVEPVRVEFLDKK